MVCLTMHACTHRCFVVVVWVCEMEQSNFSRLADLEERMASVGDDLADEARAVAVASCNLWAAKQKVDDVASAIYEVRRRRVAPKPTPLKVLQAVVYLCGIKHSALVDPYARKKSAVSWKKMRMLFKSDLVRSMQDFTEDSKVSGLSKIKGLVADLTIEDMKQTSVAIAVMLEWAQAAIAAVDAREEQKKAEAAAAEAAAAEAAAAEAAAAAAAAEGEGEAE